jgi:hypothetical protein
LPVACGAVPAGRPPAPDAAAAASRPIVPAPTDGGGGRGRGAPDRSGRPPHRRRPVAIPSAARDARRKLKRLHLS